MIAVKKTVQRYDSHSLFYKLETDTNTKNHVKELHLFTLERVITEYKTSNIDGYVIVNDTNGVELQLPFSVLSRFKYYDKYE